MYSLILLNLLIVDNRFYNENILLLRYFVYVQPGGGAGAASKRAKLDSIDIDVEAEAKAGRVWHQMSVFVMIIYYIIFCGQFCLYIYFL